MEKKKKRKITDADGQELNQLLEWWRIKGKGHERLESAAKHLPVPLNPWKRWKYQTRDDESDILKAHN